MRAANPGFQHPAAPDGNVSFLTYVMNCNGLSEAAHPSHLDVDDPACAKFNSGFGVSRIMNGLIQTDRCLQFTLQFCVAQDVVMPQRLLDHEQVELLELT